MERAQLEQRLIAPPSRECKRQLEFLTGDKTCTIENADIISFEIDLPPKTSWLGGTWMDSAPLTYLARVCDIADRLLGKDWIRRFMHRITNREDLLNLLNEIWWIGCWDDISDIVSGPKAHGGGDNDWGFTLSGNLLVKMQVKRRRNDLVRIAHPTRPPFGMFDELSKRFTASEPGQINVGAITIYAGITDSVLRFVDDYFQSKESEHVDAIAIWCPSHHPKLPSFFIRDRKSRGQLKRSFKMHAHDSLYRTSSICPLSFRQALGI